VTVGLPNLVGDIESVIRRYDRAVARRDLWRGNMQDCYLYAIPDRELFMQQSPGQKRGQYIFDSTAQEAVQEFASRIQSTICPPWRQWSKLMAGPALPKAMRDSDELAVQLEEQTEIFFTYINHSNFVLKSHEAFQDLSVGTGALTCELNEQRNGLVFDAIPPALLAIEEGPTGLVETTFIDRKCPPEHLLRIYPTAQLPQQFQQSMRDNPMKDIEYQVGCVYEPRLGDYHLIVFAKQHKHVMYTRNYGKTSPCIVFRWSSIAGEDWGRGPVMTALPNIKTLNVVVEYVLRGGALTAMPPYTAVADGVINPYTVRIDPTAVIPVASNDHANPTIRQLEARASPEMSQIILEDMRMAVRRALFSDPRRREGPIQTATEVLIEDREFIQRIGSSFGRLQTEFIERVINRGIDVLQSIGKMAAIRVDGKEVTLKHMSPLARAQDQDELMALRTGFEMAAPLGPEALMLTLKPEMAGEWIFKKAGVPNQILRSDGERAKLMKELAGAAQQAAEAQMAQGKPPVAA
jgi:hypothetical protein